MKGRHCLLCHSMDVRVMVLGQCVTGSLLRSSFFLLIFTGPLTSEAFAEGDTCDEAWIYVDRTGIDLPVKNTAFTRI